MLLKEGQCIFHSCSNQAEIEGSPCHLYQRCWRSYLGHDCAQSAGTQHPGSPAAQDCGRAPRCGTLAPLPQIPSAAPGDSPPSSPGPGLAARACMDSAAHRAFKRGSDGIGSRNFLMITRRRPLEAHPHIPPAALGKSTLSPPGQGLAGPACMGPAAHNRNCIKGCLHFAHGMYKHVSAWGLLFLLSHARSSVLDLQLS